MAYAAGSKVVATLSVMWFSCVSCNESDGFVWILRVGRGRGTIVSVRMVFVKAHHRMWQNAVLPQSCVALVVHHMR